ncbi:MAG: ABC transporter ATP-binding protein [Eubacterium sp.]|nr:ABC transporter ATP-binding protein [Eubacterium sp.]
METINCRNVMKKFGKTEALNGVSFSLESGRIVGLLGPNGSGKTTLIKILNGLMRVDDGAVTILGKEIGKETKAVAAYLPDRTFLPDHMRVGKLLKYYQDFFKDFDRQMAERLLGEMGVDVNAKFGKCSKGTKEKICLILTVSRRAKVYFFDEPIAGVDPAARERILRVLVENYAEDAVVLLSTHLIADVEPILDDIMFLNKGVITLHEDADSLRERTGKSVDELFREEFKC